MAKQKVKITGKDAGATKAIKDVEKQATKSGATIKRDLRGGFLAAGAAATAAVLVMKKMTQTWHVQEQADIKLANALRATGSAATLAEFKELASDLQNVTTFGDETTQSAAALAIQMGVQAEQVKSLLPLVQDFAAANGQDLTSAMRIVGQAIVADASMLKRYGIILTDAETKTFKVADQTERTALLMKKLEDSVGGVAKKLAKTASGAMTQFHNTLGDLSEQSGRFIEAAGAAFLGDGQVIGDTIREWTRELETFLDLYKRSRELTADAEENIASNAAELDVRKRLVQLDGEIARIQGSAMAGAETLLAIKLEEQHRLLLEAEAMVAARKKQAEPDAAAAGGTGDGTDKKVRGVKKLTAATDDLSDATDELADAEVLLALKILYRRKAEEQGAARRAEQGAQEKLQREEAAAFTAELNAEIRADEEALVVAQVAAQKQQEDQLRSLQLALTDVAHSQEFVNAAVSAGTSAIFANIQALAAGSIGAGQAAAQMAQQMIAAIGQQAAMKGALAIAEGIFALASLNPMAGAYFAAGAKFLAVAAVAGAAAGTISKGASGAAQSSIADNAAGATPGGSPAGGFPASGSRSGGGGGGNQSAPIVINVQGFMQDERSAAMAISKGFGDAKRMGYLK